MKKNNGIYKVGNREFLILWIESFLVAEAAAFLSIVIIFFILNLLWGVGWSSLLLVSVLTLIAVLICFFGLVIYYSFTVSSTLNFIIERFGHKCEPLKPGYYVFCPFIKKFNPITYISMRQETMYVLTGSREGVPKEISEKYVYGSETDLVPKIGDNLKLMVDVEVIITNPLLAYYAHNDIYKYVASLVDLLLGKYVAERDHEEVVKGYRFYNWMLEVKALGGLVSNYGIDIVNFRPVNLIISQSAVNDRAKIQSTIRQGRNLEGEVDNMALKAKIAEVESSIAKQRLDYLISAGLQPEEAAKIVKTEMSMKTIIEASKRGDLTYVGNNDGSIGTIISAGNVLKKVLGK